METDFIMQQRKIQDSDASSHENIWDLHSSDEEDAYKDLLSPLHKLHLDSMAGVVFHKDVDPQKQKLTQEANRKWNMYYGDYSAKCTQPKIHFAQDGLLQTFFFHGNVWPPDSYREARQNTCEDRHRFLDRIYRAERTIAPVIASHPKKRILENSL